MERRSCPIPRLGEGAKRFAAGRRGGQFPKCFHSESPRAFRGWYPPEAYVGGLATCVARVQCGHQPTFALCAAPDLLSEWAREMVTTNRKRANFPSLHRFSATSALWQPMREKPIDASVSVAGGKPTWPGADAKVIISRMVALRRAAGAPFTQMAVLLPAPLAWGPGRTPNRHTHLPSSWIIRLPDFHIRESVER